MDKIFHLPVLSKYDFGLFRTPGPGLGNLLFPISRALIGSHVTNGLFVMPTIRQIKFGPFLRGEPDWRTYGAIFKHRSVQNWKYRVQTIWATKITEDENQNLLGGSVVKYSGLNNYFHDITGYSDLLYDWLEKAGRNQKFIQQSYDIAVHIRLGDFSTYQEGKNNESMRQPFKWYRAAVYQAARTLGLKNPKIVIFTDNPKEVEPLANEWSADIDNAMNALKSILTISQAAMIVASRSTFSMWGAFLGNSPAIWPKEFDLEPYWADRGALDIKLKTDDA